MTFGSQFFSRQSWVRALKLSHAWTIFRITFELYEINQTLDPFLFVQELLLTLIITWLDRKQKGRDWKQLLFSLSLVYALRPSELNVLRFLFLAKIFYVHNSLQQWKQLVQCAVRPNKFIRLFYVIIGLLGLLAVFYMSLGFLVVAYKYWAYLWEDPEKVLSTHQIFYFFMITSSSIGYGDITPKNQYQMYFLIAFIPVLVVIFGQMCGHAVNYFTQFVAILRENPHSNLKANLLSESVWGKEDCENLIDYIAHAQFRNSDIQADQELTANNWLSFTCLSFKEREPLVIQILGSELEDSKELRFLLASKIRKQFYPKNWKIIEKGNIDRNIYLIEEGQVQVNGKILGPGSIFNSSGFAKEEPSAETYLTKEFTGVWTISEKDLMDLGKNSLNLKTRISKKFSSIEQNL